MKVSQNARHFASKAALETPGVRTLAKKGLVTLHTNVFLKKADEHRREERKARLDGLFDATIDAYLAALQEGYEEERAREITHVQANFDFYNHGWTEMMEFPADEIEDHYERYREFFERHAITIDDPLGKFAPDGDLPDAPSTPEKLADPEHPHAEGGFADDVYVEDADGNVHVGGREDVPEDVDLGDAPGVEEPDSE